MTRVKFVSREKYSVFLKRAAQYHTTMESAYNTGDYDACVGSAVHCTISIVDAISVRMLGRKSSAQNHMEIVLMLKEVKTTNEMEKARVCDMLPRIIEMKTLAEYEDRNMSKADAEKTKQTCEKIYTFIITELKKMVI